MTRGPGPINSLCHALIGCWTHTNQRRTTHPYPSRKCPRVPQVDGAVAAAPFSHCLVMPLLQSDVGVRHSLNPYPSPRTLSNMALARPRYDVILDRSRGPSWRMPHRTNSS